MNLLHIGKFYPPYRGGMETYLCDLAEAQVKQGHQVKVLVHNHDWQRLKSVTTVEQSMPGLTVIRQACLRPVLFTPWMLGLNKQVKRIIHEHHIDIIHLHVPNPSLFQLLFNRSAKNIPWVMRWHADMVTSSSSGLMRFIYRCVKPIETALIKKARQVIVSTPEYLKHSPQLIKFADRVSVIPLGLNISQVIVPKDKPVSDKAFQVLSVGRLSYYKNHRLLIDAMEHLPNMQLTIAGDGDLKAELQRHIQSKQLSHRVTLTGAVTESEKNQLLEDCHVFCLASNDRAESYGVVLLEAMARHKITLAADTEGSGMSWLANNYPRGYTFGNNDLTDLVAKLKQLQNNYTTIIKQPVDFNLTIEQTATAIFHLYQQILSSESP
ncbi:MAG: glycosyltransferase [Proteobacteria bacterium]|nr:MAG: glycosyltransferase [Pseudomonadota bacterium]